MVLSPEGHMVIKKDKQGPYSHEAYILAQCTEIDGKRNAKTPTSIYLDSAVQIPSKSQYPNDMSLFPLNNKTRNRHLFYSSQFHHFDNCSKD